MCTAAEGANTVTAGWGASQHNAMSARLRELQATANANADIEKGDTSEQFMTDFFEEVGTIKASMSTIRHNIEAIEDNFGSYITAVTTDQTKEHASELDRLVDATNEEFKLIDVKLKDMKKKNTELLEAGNSEVRIRTNMHHTLTKKYLDLVSTYQEVQNKYKNMHREKIERQLKIVNPDATPEDIEHAIATGSTDDLFAKQMLDKRYKQEADQAHTYVMQKHKQIQKLEASIEELHQLFIDMSILVETQGELIDQIEKNVQDSKAYTAEGVKQLRKAGKYQKAARKKMCCILLCILIILAAM